MNVPARVSALGLLVALGAGCPPKAPPEEPAAVVVDPLVLLAQAQREPAPGPSAASFDLRVRTPDQNIAAQGALVVVPPAKFRVEVRGPIGGPQLVVVSDGEGLRAWVAADNALLVAPDADARIRAYTGDEAGLDALASLLLGRLPALDRPPLFQPTVPPSFRWPGPGQSHLDATLDSRTAHLVALSLADEAGAALLEADVAGAAWPTRLEVRIPTKGIVAELAFGEWRPATPSDAAFVLAPAGATTRPLEIGGPPPAAPVAPGG